MFTCVGLEYGDDTVKLYPERLFQEKFFRPLSEPIKVCIRKSSEGPSHSASICGAQKPLNFRRSWFSHDFSATHVSILTSEFSKIFFKISSANNRTFRYPRIKQSLRVWFLSSFRYMTLAPNHLRRTKARPVIYYDFMIGWLLPSPPPGCLCLDTSFSTQSWFEDLIGRSGLFPSRLQTLSPEVCLEILSCVFGVSLDSVRLWATLVHRVLYPPWKMNLRSTSIDFAENQLFPSLISLSPLATSHPCILQHTWVRSSKMCYHIFNLLMARSLGFGSYCINLCLNTIQFPLWEVVFTSPPPHGLSLLMHYTRWPIMQKVHRYREYDKIFINTLLRLIVRMPFQDLFHSLVKGSFHLSLTVLVHYRW